MEKKILVLGGTGMLGQPVSHSLREAGFQVRILTRDFSKANKIFDDSFELVSGDPMDTSCLENALTGCYGVHISLPEVELPVAETVAKMAGKLGLEQITYISGATVAEKNRWFPMVAQKLDAEKAIRNCGVAYTIFCPTWPMEQLVRFFQNGKPSMIGKQPLPVHFFAAQDLGRMVSKSYQLAKAQNKRFYVYGPEAMTLKTALERYCTKFYPNVEKITVMPVWMAKLAGTLTGNKMLKFASDLMNYFEKTPETGDPTEANQILGGPSITLDSWMELLKSN
jgi:uncharacterized protein YbjT (DUF2867 family)